MQATSELTSFAVVRIPALVTIQSSAMNTCSGYAQSTAATGQKQPVTQMKADVQRRGDGRRSEAKGITSAACGHPARLQC
jgi:hypothetical protein